MAELLIVAAIQFGQTEEPNLLESRGYTEIVRLLNLVESKSVVNFRAGSTILRSAEQYLSPDISRTLNERYQQSSILDSIQYSILYLEFTTYINNPLIDYEEGLRQSCSEHGLIPGIKRYFRREIPVNDWSSFNENHLNTFIGKFVQMIYKSEVSIPVVHLEMSQPDEAAQRRLEHNRILKEFIGSIGNYLDDLSGYTDQQRAALLLDKMVLMCHLGKSMIHMTLIQDKDTNDVNLEKLGQICDSVIDEVRIVQRILNRG